MIFWLSIILLVINLLIAFVVWNASRYFSKLPELSNRVSTESAWPHLSVVVAARNEELSIGAAVLSLLQQDYPHYELIVVNDRSTDQTGQILSHIQASFTSLRVVTIEELPDGWLGKCYAMHMGAMHSSGDWILFTDGDVSMKPDTLKRAVAQAESQGIDHMAMAPLCVLPSWWLTGYVAAFVVLFKLFVRPSQIRNPRSKAHVGVGAFNLIRRRVYDGIGGHERIKLRPDDDLKLGKLVKLGGYSQCFINGIELITVPWYRTSGEMMRGLEKNSFAGVDYSLTKIVVANIFLVCVFMLPFGLLGLASGASFWLALICCLVILALGVQNALSAGYRVDHGLIFPLGVAFLLFVMNRAVLLALWRNGVSWRGTFYSLQDLRSNVV